MATRRDFLAGALAAALAPRAFAADPPNWERLRKGGFVLLMRHAATVAAGADPRGFKLSDCASQLTLSDDGRADAIRIGERLKQERVPIGKVYSSPWCRCHETAMLAFGKAEDWAALGTTFYEPDKERDYTQRVKQRIGGYSTRDMGGNMVMVTHNTNIAALTKLSVPHGGMVILRPDGCCGFKVVEPLEV
ncbi:MAG TPA: histidine phosphatase family protein [Usitatibacter sp.]|nr:histidine phosphatase family protein [Usitatibacter sp.]